MLKIDGGLLEGGGQVVRVALGLAAGLRRDIRVENIRGKRSVPGLRPQHVASVKLVADLSSGAIDGCEVGSKEVSLSFPREDTKQKSHYEADAGTAGAVSLMAQAALPAAYLFPDTELRLRGGTNVSHSPNIDHVKLVLAPNLALLGLELEVDVLRRGWFPVGGGEAILRTRKTSSTDVDLSAAEATPLWITGVVAFSNVPMEKIESLKEALEAELERVFFISSPTNVRLTIGESPNEGSQRKKRRKIKAAVAIQLALRTSSGATIGADILNEHAESIDDNMAADLVAILKDRSIHAGAGVDTQTADQLIVFAALRDGRTCFRCPTPTCQHLETSIHFTSLLTGVPFILSKEDNKTLVVDCPGRTMSEKNDHSFQK